MNLRPPLPQDQHVDLDRGRRYLPCPKCGERVLRIATKCRFCSEELVPMKPPSLLKSLVWGPRSAPVPDDALPPPLRDAPTLVGGGCRALPRPSSRHAAAPTLRAV